MFRTFGSRLSPGLVSYHFVTGATDRQPSSSRFPSMTILPLSREMLTSSPLVGGAAATAREAGAAINNSPASRRRPE